MSKLYTLDTEEYDHIKEDAEITFDELGDVANEINNNDNYYQKITGWAIGGFFDCWVKLHKEPELDSDGYAEIEGIKCHVLKPGSHPGGRAYWLNPVNDVYIPIWEDK